LDKGSKDVDGKTLSQHFGQGTASQTPYLSWYVVSIYYLVEDSTIIIGIEKNRYSHLPQMMPIRYGKFGRKEEVAIFYEKAKDKLDYAELYEKFISISEEVLHLGTEDK
jgi:hypothetical protein